MSKTIITSNGKNVLLQQLLMLAQPCPQTFIQVICVFPCHGLLTPEALCLSQGECPWGTVELYRSEDKDFFQSHSNQCQGTLNGHTSDQGVENDTQHDQY